MNPQFTEVPQAIRERSRRDPRLVPIRLELFPTETKWRAVPDFEHSTLCRAFGLDPATFWFELPRSALGMGSNRAGYGGSDGKRRTVDGFVFAGPKGTDPVGKLIVCFDSERFRDRDPLSRSDFERLGDTL